MRLELLTTLEQLTLLREEWNRLAAGVPLRGPAWLLSWWRAFGGRHKLHVLALRSEEGELLGLAPWYRRDAAAGRVLAFLGSGTACTDYTTVLAKPGRETAVAGAVAGWLREHADSWDVLELFGVEERDSTITALVAELRSEGCGLLESEPIRAWRIPLPADWEAFMAMQSKSHRKQIRRVQERLFVSGRAVLHSARDSATLAEGMAIFRDLHQRRRESLGEPGCFAQPEFAAFFEYAAEALLASGELGLRWVTLDGRPIAAEFHLEGTDVTYAYQAGVDPDQLEEEPGRLINTAAIMRAIERKRQGFDFLRGDEHYKAHWRAEPRTLLQLRLTAPSASGRVRRHARNPPGRP